jgi:hypothetical protein
VCFGCTTLLVRFDVVVPPRIFNGFVVVFVPARVNRVELILHLRYDVLAVFVEKSERVIVVGLIPYARDVAKFETIRTDAYHVLAAIVNHSIVSH